MLFDYTAGQFAFFDIGGVYNDPKGPIKHFTISSSPTENFIMFSTRIRDSPYKNRLLTLEEGAKVKVRGPEGQFVLHQDYSKPAVFLSGGIGVTPFRTMIKYATDKQLPVKIVMFDSNRNLSNILFKTEFDDWAGINKNLKIIYTISEVDRHEQTLPSSNDWKGEHGRINKAMILKYVDTNVLNNSIFYICGPPSMLKAMQALLQEDLDIPKDRIKVEEFTGY
jgi:glycine betaine catabolism B